MSTLYYGDNLDVLRRHIKDATIDLVYLDPPFNSDSNYNAFLKEKDGTLATSQIRAFEDTWRWNIDSEQAYEALVLQPNKLSQAMQALRALLGTDNLMAYLAMMAPRLVELHRVLKPTGSLYLHCDSTASHYLRILLDAIFGLKNFRNEIFWYYYNKFGSSKNKLFSNATDTIFFYIKDVEENFVFNSILEKREKPVKQLLRKSVDGKMVNAKDKNGHVIYRFKEDRMIDNVWRIPCLQPASPERLGYPTQKPLALLERIIQASSNPGDTILDPFSGCGTAVDAAQKLGRNWIGIDITQLSITLVKKRLRDNYGKKLDIKIIGEPVTIEDATTLAANDKMQFQWWALGLVDARPLDQKHGADGGIDGRILFSIDKKAGKAKQVIISVKGGKTGVHHVRDLRGVLDREKAEIGVLVTLEPPTSPMTIEAASAGFWGDYPRIQILTIEELLVGKNIRYPTD